MAYKVVHISDDDVKNDNVKKHETHVQEALNGIGENEIYSVEHAVTRIPSYRTYSTIIIYREYEDTV